MTISQTLEEYKKSLVDFRQALSESEAVLTRDGGSGVVLTKSPTLGFVEQPYIQFTAGAKFSIRGANFDVNTASLVLQSESCLQTSPTITRICKFEVVQAEKLISLHSTHYQRLLTGSDFSYSADRRRQSLNSYHTSSYYLHQIDDLESETKLMGQRGFYEINAANAINFQSRNSHFVVRCKKSFLAQSEDFLVKAASGVNISAGGAGSVSATTSLTLSGAARAALSSAGITSVSAIGAVLISGLTVRINEGAKGGGSNVVDLDKIDKLLAAGAALAEDPSLPNAIQVVGGAVIANTGLVKVTNSTITNKLVNAALNATAALASGGPAAALDSLINSGTQALTEGLTNLANDATKSLINQGASSLVAREITDSAIANGVLNTLDKTVSNTVRDLASTTINTGLLSLKGKLTTPQAATSKYGSFLTGAGSDLVAAGSDLFATEFAKFVNNPNEFFADLSADQKAAAGEEVPAETTPPTEGETPSEDEVDTEALPPPPALRQNVAYTGATKIPTIAKLPSGLGSAAPTAPSVVDETQEIA
jgi:hypothetical protein